MKKQAEIVYTDWKSAKGWGAVLEMRPHEQTARINLGDFLSLFVSFYSADADANADAVACLAEVCAPSIVRGVVLGRPGMAGRSTWAASK
jgi:hypothetical protein